ncbi:MAG: FkbM family methyltransferase [Desulfarculales bacterium]|jgi:FkbM family methyltransferase|nr:FkbM family methyltransferase [Desulfarculales bacterium]
MLNQYHLFPFDQVPKGGSIVLYGAGAVGYEYLTQVQAIDYCRVLFVADKRFAELHTLRGVEVCSPELLLSTAFDCVVVAAKSIYRDSIISDLERIGIAAGKLIIAQNGHICKDDLFAKNGLFTGGGSLFGNFTYAQHGEDFVILNIFKLLGIDKPTYIDVGAHHPFEISNTALLYRSGSRGINIEANPNLFEAFISARPEDVNLNIGVGTKPGKLIFYMIDDFSALNTFSLEEAYAIGQARPELASPKTMQLPVATLDDIVGQYANGKYPDYLDIDIEGWDFSVLSASRFSAGSPIVISAETRIRETAAMNSMLAGKGYEPYVRMGGNIIYVRKGIKKQLLGG